MSQKPNLDDYVEVAERMQEFFDKHPTGSFDSEIQFAEIDGRWWAIVKSYAYRTPDDPRPGVGVAYEPIPGKTSFTKDSELQNAQTAAIGRAILCVGAATANRMASREEVRNRVYSLPDANAEGREALRALCESRHWELSYGAGLFEEHFHRAPKSAPNEDLLSFVEQVNSGTIQVGN